MITATKIKLALVNTSFNRKVYEQKDELLVVLMSLTINGMMFLALTVFPCKVNSPHVKQNLISVIINSAYELLQALLNGSRVTTLGK